MEAFFDQCYALYQSVDPQLARKLAAKITEAINQALVEDTYAKSNSFTTPEAKYPINIPVQPAALPVVCEMLILCGNRILVQSITVCFPTITLQLSNFFISVFI